MLYEHFKKGNECNLSNLKIQPIEKNLNYKNPKTQKSERRRREAFWIKELRTLTPYGLNNRLGNKNWRFRSWDEIVGVQFNSLPPRHHNNKSGCSGKGKNRIKHFNTDNFINDLKNFYVDLKNWRFS